jgi:lipid II:glycine glycyltransferase (peptidoglycan interpeptide bridge formation enzyme)
MKKNIKKSQRSEVTIEEIEDQSNIRIFYNFLVEVYHDVKVPHADISLFESIFDVLQPKGMAKFHLAKHNGKYIGGRLSFIYKKVIYDEYAGVPGKYKKLYPNALLNWHVMQWGSENGYNIFDFGGAGKPNVEYGVRNFKRQFGGELVNYGRYRKEYSAIKMKIAEICFQIYKKRI